MRYWLMKSEPSAYGIDDLARDGRTPWDGVRNYQARNFMRDDMREGDTVFFYHSNVTDAGIVGEARVCSKAYPDPTAFDPRDSHYDPSSDRADPRWYLVDVCFVRRYAHPLTLRHMRQEHALQDMVILRRGNRLSITPVSATHAAKIRSMVD